MKYFLSFVCSIVLFFGATAQDVVPFIDFNGFFKSYQNGFFRQIEFQRVSEFKTGDDVVAYINYRGNLTVFDGSKPEEISNVVVEYKVSDHLMTWKIGPTLNLWDAGEKRTLTFLPSQTS